ncbi:DNA cytosine methyltransferase [Desulforamulus hydrothermalis]|uniref:DNA (cytosine-5-)-methyltransferase n=1 Tax=Desulforamulus hydrothermalis Lam5 = DSM 18033 TaxID=1121428 RepID=K8DYY3_9FIRM|nr:DNA cytosine methyltransferase [Desulforamulus hydrothermalis]CCO08060.1 DNA-cytosine methyltransferase [Desulforamulus hydrothermalis Lam5 = DSM 18033]SHG82996.1 DNA (cytosine-5)-methyltransferase 1 [Desulforamulus hydrothermalis Lam5 = DSM 18033]
MAICKQNYYKNSLIIEDIRTNTPYYHPGVFDFPNLPYDLPMISLFTGAGGLDLGLERAGFSTRAYVENNKYCIETIKINRKEWRLVGNGDITKTNSKEILKTAGLKIGEAALLAGGAPCQPFSSLGKNEGDSVSNGKLYKYFIQMVKEIQPVTFIFENVRGMVQNHKKVIEFMEQEFGKSGYGISIALICAADYGVPQKRYRVFIIGRRDGKKPGFPFPTHAENPESSLKYFNTLCALKGVPFPYQKLKKWVTVGEVFSRLTKEHYNRKDNFYAQLSPKIVEMISYIKPKTKMCWADLPDDLKFNCWKKGKFQGRDNFSRLQYNEPSVTIRTGAIYPAKGKYIHPELNRGLSTIEMAALQSFPLNPGNEGWHFYGGILNVARQIGNAVPPLLAEAIGHALKQQVLEIINGAGC